MSIMVARIDQPRWRELAGRPCDGQGSAHAAQWVMRTTGQDDMRFACDAHLAAWVKNQAQS